MDLINKYINANGKMIKKENIKSTYKVYIILLVLVSCLLAFAGGFIGILGIVIVTLYFITATAYNHSIVKKPSTFRKVFTSYFLLFGYLLVSFNLSLYSIPVLMKLNVNKFILLIFAFEILCIVFGCFYTFFSIKMNKIKEYKQANTLSNSIIFTLSGCWTIFLRRYVSTKPVEMRAFIMLTTFAIVCSLFAFYIGRIYIPMLYFIIKYKINDFSFTNE